MFPPSPQLPYLSSALCPVQPFLLEARPHVFPHVENPHPRALAKPARLFFPSAYRGLLLFPPNGVVYSALPYQLCGSDRRSTFPCDLRVLDTFPSPLLFCQRLAHLAFFSPTPRPTFCPCRVRDPPLTRGQNCEPFLILFPFSSH